MRISKDKRGRAAPTQLIIQALSAAEASISLAKQLLAAQSGRPLTFPSHDAGPRPASWRTASSSTRDLPGIVGKFDGEKMVTDNGKTYPVPTNYAGKSKLVFGDTLKMLENADGTHLFKQIEKVNRKKAEGKLVKKGEQWWVAAKEGEYKVLNSNVSFLGGQVGDETFVLLPENDPSAPWAAIDAIPVRDAERRARRAGGPPVGEVAAKMVAEERPEREAAPGLVEKLLSKVTAGSGKKEKVEEKKEEKAVKKSPRRAAAKASAASRPVVKEAAKEKEEEKKKEATPPPSPPAPPVVDEEELR